MSGLEVLVALAIAVGLVGMLVPVLPGSLLTTAVIELATGQMSGAGRLAQGVTQLVLLSLGIVAAGQLVGVPTTAQGWTPTGAVQEILPWLGVAIFAVGAVLANNARPSSRVSAVTPSRGRSSKRCAK